MSKLEVDTIAPQSGTTVTLGESGDTVTVPTGVTFDTSNSTVTLPDSSVSLAKLTATGTKDATTFLRGDNTFAEAGGGIEMAQQWRLTTSFTGTANPISSNLEIVDTYGYGGIGSNMTESSGIFTFPSTGIYLIKYNKLSRLNGDDRLTEGNINTTTDGTNFNLAVKSFDFIQQTSSLTTFSSGYCEFMFDVTNTSTHKVSFSVFPVNSSTQTEGNTDNNTTTFTFIKLGDT